MSSDAIVDVLSVWLVTAACATYLTHVRTRTHHTHCRTREQFLALCLLQVDYQGIKKSHDPSGIENTIVDPRKGIPIEKENRTLYIERLLPKTVYTFNISAKFIDGTTGPPYTIHVETSADGMLRTVALRVSLKSGRLLCSSQHVADLYIRAHLHKYNYDIVQNVKGTYSNLGKKCAQIWIGNCLSNLLVSFL